MSDSGSSFALAQSRIAEIQSRFMPAPAPKATDSTDFASALQNAQSQLDGGGVSGDDIVQDAMKYLGVPYKWGGTDPSTGVDCSGFVQDVYGDMGITLPRTAAAQAQQGTPVASLADAKPGDLVAFDDSSARPGIDHIGIYVGNNQMIVAPHTGDVVKIQTITDKPVAIRRLVSNDSVDLNSLASLAYSPTSANLGNTTQSTGLAAYRSMFISAGQKYGVDPNLLAAVAKAESNFNPSAISGAGAKGLMQIMPGTAAGLGVNPMDPAQAIDGAARLLSQNLKAFGSTDLAVAAYNAGAGAVKKYGGIPPYSETQNYVAKVRSYLSQHLTNSGAIA